MSKSRSVRTGKAEEPKSVYHRDYAKVAKPVLKFGKKGTEDGEFQTTHFIASNSRGGDHCRGQTQSSCSSV